MQKDNNRRIVSPKNIMLNYLLKKKKGKETSF